jgi:hypothetical protein
MSPAEYFELINMAGDSAATHAMNAVTIYFAYLAATYFTGNKLTPFQAVALTAIYSIFLTVPVLTCLSSIKLMGVHIQQFRAAHPELLPIYASGPAGGLRSYVLYIIPIVWLVAWVLSILFMVSKRRQ